jgi:hypothetical protein
MAKVISTYNTDGTSQEEFLPEPSDFLFVFVPEHLPDSPEPPKIYLDMVEKIKKSELIAPIHKIVEFINEDIDNIRPVHNGGADHWLSERTDWWKNAAESYRNEFLNSFLPNYRLRQMKDEEIWKSVYGFPKCAVFDVIIEVGPILTYMVPYDRLIEAVYPGDLNAEGADRNTTTEASGSNDTCSTSTCTGNGGCNSNPAEVCCSPREGSDGACDKEGGGSCCR